MARIRTIKPEMRRSQLVSSWPYPVRWTFVGLPGYLDDEGRGLDDTRLIKAELYPLDDDMTARKVDAHLGVIAGQGPLCRYEVDGRRYLHITSWAEHQRVNRPTPSRIPPCPVHETSGSTHVPLTEDSLRAHARKGKEQGKEGNREESAAADAPPRTDVEGLCRYFLAAIAKNGAKGTITEKWRTEARLLLDRDQRDPSEIRSVIDWAASDSFWKANVLSVPKLREKYDQLRLAMQRQRPSVTSDDPHKAHMENW